MLQLTFVNKYNWKEVNYPSGKDGRKKSQKSNPTIALNVLYVLKIDIYPAYILKLNLNCEKQILVSVIFLNCDSLHARLNSHYKTWSFKKREHKKIKAYMKSLYKEPTVDMCLLILDLKPLRL